MNVDDTASSSGIDGATLEKPGAAALHDELNWTLAASLARDGLPENIEHSGGFQMTLMAACMHACMDAPISYIVPTILHGLLY